MQDIQSIPGKLFYEVYEMYKQNTIDARGKQILKDLIILNNPQITAVYEEYCKSGTQLTLRNDLLKVYKKERDIQKAEGLSDRSRKSKSIKPLKILVPPKNIQKVPAHMRP